MPLTNGHYYLTAAGVYALGVTDGGTPPALPALAAPTLNQATGLTSSSATLSWSAVANATGYRHRRNGQVVYTGPATSYQHTGLSSDTDYAFDVQAVGNGTSQSDSVFSNVVSARTSFAYDPDALAYLTEIGATNETERRAINAFVVGAKTRPATWNGRIGIFPVYGGTAAHHAVNLKNPAGPRATLYGSPTHSGNGIGLNGVSQYIDSNLAANAAGGTLSYGYYNRDNTSPGTSDPINAGAWNSVGQGSLLTARLDGSSGYRAHGELRGMATPNVSGYFQLDAEPVGARVTRNGVVLAASALEGIVPTANVTFGCLLLGGPYGNVVGTYCHMQVGAAMSADDAAFYYSLVQQLQTALNRAV